MHTEADLVALQQQLAVLEARKEQVLSELHGSLGPLVFAQGGALSQFTGDGMLFDFNDPVPTGLVHRLVRSGS